MSAPHDPLWDPTLEPDAELQRLQSLLAPLGARRRALAHRLPPLPTRPARARRIVRRVVQAVAAIAAACVLSLLAHHYRLDWREGAAWSIRDDGRPAAQRRTEFAPGDVLQTGEAESLTLRVARIGHLTLSPQSRLRLVETAARRHRVDLAEGHLRARIWAPPGVFGLSDGHSEAIDFGCEFEIWKQADGQGRLHVRSGWVLYRVGAREILVPQDYAIDFDARGFGLPLRPTSSPDFVAAAQALQAALERSASLPTSASSGPAAAAAPSASTNVDAAPVALDGDRDAVTVPGSTVPTPEPDTAADATPLAAHVARLADDADAYTLLALLSEHPQLADTELYARLARALGAPADDPGHRRAWRAGDMRAVNAWWRYLPTQPKRWWVNWADMF